MLSDDVMSWTCALDISGHIQLSVCLHIPTSMQHLSSGRIIISRTVSRGLCMHTCWTYKRADPRTQPNQKLFVLPKPTASLNSTDLLVSILRADWGCIWLSFDLSSERLLFQPV